MRTLRTSAAFSRCWLIAGLLAASSFSARAESRPDSLLSPPLPLPPCATPACEVWAVSGGATISELGIDGDGGMNNAIGVAFTALGFLDPADGGAPRIVGDDLVVGPNNTVVGKVIKKNDKVIGFSTPDGARLFYDLGAALLLDAWAAVDKHGRLIVYSHGLGGPERKPPFTRTGIKLDHYDATADTITMNGFAGVKAAGAEGGGTGAEGYPVYELPPRADATITVELRSCYSGLKGSPAEAKSVAATFLSVPGIAMVVAGSTLYGNYSILEIESPDSAAKAAALQAAAKKAGVSILCGTGGGSTDCTQRWVWQIPFSKRLSHVKATIAKGAPPVPEKVRMKKYEDTGYAAPSGAAGGDAPPEAALGVSLGAPLGTGRMLDAEGGIAVFDESVPEGTSPELAVLADALREPLVVELLEPLPTEAFFALLECGIGLAAPPLDVVRTDGLPLRFEVPAVLRLPLTCPAAGVVAVVRVEGSVLVPVEFEVEEGAVVASIVAGGVHCALTITSDRDRDRADLVPNLEIDSADLAALLAAWGSAGHVGDLNCDGTVDGGDLGLLLNGWGLIPSGCVGSER